MATPWCNECTSQQQQHRTTALRHAEGQHQGAGGIIQLEFVFNPNINIPTSKRRGFLSDNGTAEWRETKLLSVQPCQKNVPQKSDFLRIPFLLFSLNPLSCLGSAVSVHHPSSSIGCRSLVLPKFWRNQVSQLIVRFYAAFTGNTDNTNNDVSHRGRTAQHYRPNNKNMYMNNM